MSFIAQDLLRKISLNSHKSHDQSSKKDVRKKDFRELLKTKEVAEHAPSKDFFSMVAEDKGVECKDPMFSSSALALQAASGMDSSQAAPISSVAIALSADIEAAFEKMASCMLVMSSSHEVETTLFLDNPHFASSSLFGTTITIREFSTAPKAFNVEIVSNPSAIAIIDASKNDLLSSFRNGNFNFSIHRFDTHLESSEGRPLFHRKEGTGQENDQSGGNP